ncbi:hypothetical protein AYI70_g12423 [Smittium culicis]|uniref:Uncharacterized protein n=1 Tax=Smittium culicis TaxID=133412 RepID=A0A1R1WXL1_9FUNG|nr:hypothetical protein AYI70_g12415 [Smittium culicis]OMJ07115.1 hypothetical protein AYI70_g12423 [Smittium culicis]
MVVEYNYNVRSSITRKSISNQDIDCYDNLFFILVALRNLCQAGANSQGGYPIEGWGNWDRMASKDAGRLSHRRMG